MRKWVLPLLLIFFMLLPIGVHAQDLITLNSLQIQIWPEYDKPTVLVIYNLTLSDTTSLPTSVSIPIPIDAGEPNAVAARQVDGSLYSIDYNRTVAGEWAMINFTATTPDIQLEYYDPGLTQEGTTRHYQYTWPGAYAVSQLTIQVQQPLGATEMRISPSLGAGATGSDNLTYFTQNIGAITADQTINITVDYQKSTAILSAENLAVQPSAAIPQSAAPDLNFSSWLPWILGIVGASLIIGSIVWFWQTGRQRPVTQIRRRRSRAAVAEPEVDPSSAEAAVYCSQCGKRASPGDQFCRSCGTQIRGK